MARLLLVEDEPRVADFLLRGLAAEGHVVVHERALQAARERLRDERFDLAIFDRMLGNDDGATLAAELRALGHGMPILMLSALDAVEDRIAGLRAGADDYLTKPFAFEELVVRVEALLRRASSPAPRGAAGLAASAGRWLAVGDLRLDTEGKRAERGGQAISLTAREYALLELLMRRPGRVFSREQILEQVWGLNEDPLTNVVDVYVRRLRAKIDEGRAPALIKTARGMGYRIDEAAA